LPNMNMLKQGMNRAKQMVDEKIGSAVITEIDPELQKQLAKVDLFKIHVEKILSALECYLQPDPVQRALPGLMEDTANKAEAVGEEMSSLSQKLGATDPFGSVMQNGATAFNNLGKEMRRMLTDAEKRSLAGMRVFLKDVKALKDQRTALENLRLDMDSLKGKIAHKSTDELVTKCSAASKAYDDKLGEVRTLAASVTDKSVPDLQKVYRELGEVLLEHSQHNEKIIQELIKHL